jgi:penicillin-binding protein 2
MMPFPQIGRQDPPLRFIALMLISGMAVLLAGLWYVQVASGKRHLDAQQNQSLRTLRMPAVRGQISDRHRQPLALDRPVYQVNAYLDELRPHFRAEYQRLRPKGKLTRAQISALEKQVRFHTVSNLVQRLRLPVSMTLTEPQLHWHYTNKLALPLPVVSGLTPLQVALFMERGGDVPGLDVAAASARTYPQAAAAHLVGYLKRDDSSSEDEDSFYHYRLPDFVGRTGIESLFDRQLRGRAGTRTMLVNNLGYRQSEHMSTPAEAGHNVVLTLDLTIQRAAEQALATARPDVEGAVVVMDPNNGDLLALASAPTFNPGDFVPRLESEAWDRLRDPQLRPLVLRATQERYPPGSIFKIITSLAMLEAGGVDPAETVPNPGYFQIGRRQIKDTAAPGNYNFRRAFIHSSNTYFIHHALQIGPDRLIEMGARFFLGQNTGLLPGQEVAGQFPLLSRIREGWSPGDTANLSIGQGPITVTPLQMAVMTSAIVNGGRVWWPRLVDRIESPQNDAQNPIEQFPAGRLRGELKAIPKNLDLIREAMLADVEEAEGTGRRAAVPGLKIGGKTGTAELQRDGRTVDKITWFVSFAPYDQPRYVVVVMVESGISGGLTCAPIAQKIYHAIQQMERSRTTPTVAQWNR